MLKGKVSADSSLAGAPSSSAGTTGGAQLQPGHLQHPRGYSRAGTLCGLRAALQRQRSRR